MFEVGVFHNGRATLPVSRQDGLHVPGGTLADMHAVQQEMVQQQVAQAVHAEELGYHYWFQSEHHFDTEGMEFSPNPLISGAAIATATRRIRIGQCANILPWHHPVRLAEMAAMVDVISGGRLEMGVGRGYQPRETEVLGAPFGGTIQDQEKNRAFYEEALELLLKCWTEDSFSHQGQFFSVPPSWTKWNHPQTIANLSQPGKGVDVRDVLNLGADDSMYQPEVGIMSGTVTMREISVFPQPLQRPYPQLWEPVLSPRSIDLVATHGINAVSLSEPFEYLKMNVDRYMQVAEKAGWPDRLDRGPFKRGWDSEKRRGYAMGRFVHVLEPGLSSEDKVRESVNAWLDRYPPFTGGKVPIESGTDPLNGGLWFIGSKQQVIDKILGAKDVVGYEDDFMFLAAFEPLCATQQDSRDQMQFFAEEIIPELANACGGLKPTEELGLEYSGTGSAVVS